MTKRPASTASEAARRWRRQVTLALGAGAAGVALVAWLLVANYRASLELRETLVEQLAQRVAFDAVTVGHALDAAEDEARALATSREVAVYFESRDLGMSMEYGLALSLVPIRSRVRSMVSDRGNQGSATFARVALVEPGGAPLADSGSGPLGVSLPEAAGTVQLSEDRQRLVVVQAHQFRGRVAAYVVGWLNPARILPPGEQEPGGVFRLVSADGQAWPAGEQGGRGDLLPATPLTDLPADGRSREVAARGGGPSIVVRAPVPGRALSVLHAEDAGRLIGRLSPVATARNLAAGAVVVLAAVVAAVVLSLKALLLEARLDESLRREEEVAEKHRALEAEVAERERLEAQLRHAQRLEAVGRLAGGVAHDFNNLLSVINGYTGIVLEQLPAGAPVREDIEEVRSACRRAIDLTRQLLAFGRRQVLKPQVLDLAPALAATEKMLRLLIGEDVELVTTSAAGVRPVRVDPGQLEQVLVNLVVNGRDAMPAGGRIHVSTENVEVDAEEARRQEALPGSYVRLRVEDTGLGMAAETLAHLFEPFFTTKESGKGTGLGLSTVYGIVRQSRGFVAVSSAPGRGTTFDVFLPAASGEVEPVSDPRAARPHPAAARPGEVVLVAEDEPQLRRLMAAQLSAAGFRVLVASNGQEALRIVEDHDGDIGALVTDVKMPGASGRNVAERFRARHPVAPIVFVSGYAEEAVLGDLAIGDPAAFLAKPQDLDQLVPTLRKLLDAAELSTPRPALA